MKSGLAKRYDTCDVLNILEDIPRDDTSKESSEPDDNHEDYVPPDIDANEELEDRNNVEFIEPAAPIESTRSQDKITKTNTSNPNPKRKLRSPDVKDSKKGSALVQVEYLYSVIGSSQLSPQQVKHLQTTLPQLPACKSKEKLSAQRYR